MGGLSKGTMKLGVMCSGNGTNFENIVRTCRKDEVVMMIYNTENCGAMQRAAKLGIPHCRIKSKDENVIIERFKDAGVDLIIMAGWMRVVTSKLIEAFPRRIINIHPSLLPKYKGLNVIQKALDSDDIFTGVTVHYVTEELDSGEILEQRKVPIYDGDTLEMLTQRIQRTEYTILPRAIEHVKYKIQTRTN